MVMIKKFKYQLILVSVTFSGNIFALNEILENEKVLTVHKTPTCGCCKMWMKHAEENGLTVYGQDHENLMKIKEKYNIEPQYRSCHTTVSSEGFIFEGHIPSKFIKKFLSENHPNAIGLSVPGMPLGSPGMEYKNQFMPYDVLILFKDGTSMVFAEVKQ